MLNTHTKADAIEASNLTQQPVSDVCEPTPLAVGNVQPTSELHTTEVDDTTTTTTTRPVTIKALYEFMDCIFESAQDIRNGLHQILYPTPDLVKVECYTNLQDIEQGLVDVMGEVVEFSGERDGVAELVLIPEPSTFIRLHDAVEAIRDMKDGALARALDADTLKDIKDAVTGAQDTLDCAMSGIEDFLDEVTAVSENTDAPSTGDSVSTFASYEEMLARLPIYPDVIGPVPEEDGRIPLTQLQAEAIEYGAMLCMERGVVSVDPCPECPPAPTKPTLVDDPTVTLINEQRMAAFTLLDSVRELLNQADLHHARVNNFAPTTVEQVMRVVENAHQTVMTALVEVEEFLDNHDDIRQELERDRMVREDGLEFDLLHPLPNEVSL